ncbi:Transcriptional regulator, ArsR family [Aurantiacibacter atlanticus]|uniref:Transcriptional regulator, ArsR family n=1 Tax=Aurantiacibacter atlanticus TaxID=1648404 RepID=A0A0H4VEV4_9SPHN|nr:metalloregulator ArsR/SmtB family transcription factor [Aurantiacibacter atlanticus]AKQ42880.1 Transcriptional regulator, ArsR family [Aurantiacibacter atlanticus]MDF1835070.1 metalloregulator ArsR/SmtB family transcription factor [Alteraurantiacibacter sp. bin_em_oilr2.035]
MSDEAPIDALKAAAHPLRFGILRALRETELNVGELESASGIGQPSLSQQLAVLRSAGLVETRREGKLVFYSIDISAMAALADTLAAFAGGRDAISPPRRRAPGAANFARMT